MYSDMEKLMKNETRFLLNSAFTCHSQEQKPPTQYTVQLIEMNAEKLQAQSWPAPMFSDSAALESSDPVTSDLENSAPWKPETEENFPEGGLQAWLVVFGAWCGL